MSNSKWSKKYSHSVRRRMDGQKEKEKHKLKSGDAHFIRIETERISQFPCAKYYIFVAWQLALPFVPPSSQRLRKHFSAKPGCPPCMWTVSIWLYDIHFCRLCYTPSSTVLANRSEYVVKLSHLNGHSRMNECSGKSNIRKTEHCVFGCQYECLQYCVK